MDALAVFNSLEAIFWMVVAVTVYRNSRVSPVDSDLGRIAAGWFALFGISDVFEVFTGAWWRPWPLLLLKAACVTALVTCGFVYRYRHLRRHRPRNREDRRVGTVPESEISTNS